MAKTDFKHALGVRAKDKISGFEGVITVRCEFLTGCDRYCVTPTELHDHKPIDGVYFDEAQLIILSEVEIEPKEVQSKKPGACSPNPTK